MSDAITPVWTAEEQQEWEFAKQIVEQRLKLGQANFKIRRKNYDKKLPGTDTPILQHSFLYIDGQLLRMARGKYIGVGGNGKVKIVETFAKEVFALKVEEANTAQEKYNEILMLRLVGYLKGTTHIERQHATHDKLLNREIKNKFYSVQTLLPGKNMYAEYIHPYWSYEKVLTEVDRCTLGLLAMLEIYNLHSKGILHCDIKPANFMANMAGDTIVVLPIDFGNSLFASKEQRIELNEILGTMGYLAPEVGSATWQADKVVYHIPANGKCIYSVKSDVYALGNMLKHDLGLYYSFVNQMLFASPDSRLDLQSAIIAMCKHIPFASLPVTIQGKVCQQLLTLKTAKITEFPADYQSALAKLLMQQERDLIAYFDSKGIVPDHFNKREDWQQYKQDVIAWEEYLKKYPSYVLPPEQLVKLHDGVRKLTAIDEMDDSGYTKLMHAAYNGNLAEVKNLLARGADVNIKDFYGNTALMMASEAGHLEVVHFLEQAPTTVVVENNLADNAAKLLARGQDVVAALAGAQTQRMKVPVRKPPPPRSAPPRPPPPPPPRSARPRPPTPPAPAKKLIAAQEDAQAKAALIQLELPLPPIPPANGRPPLAHQSTKET